MWPSQRLTVGKILQAWAVGGAMQRTGGQCQGAAVGAQRVMSGLEGEDHGVEGTATEGEPSERLEERGQKHRDTQQLDAIQGTQ